MKKIILFLLVFTMCISTVTVVGVAENSFTDVKKTDWFYGDVKTAVESGLVNGKTATTYCPDDNLTYAEAIKLAACMNQLYTEGKVTLEGGNPWYMPYVEYCKAENIIKKEYNYDEKVTRAGYMEIFALAIPDEALAEVNFVADNSIPDVASDKTYAAPVYKLYRAGILQGVDEEHNCTPFANIKRSEVAAILTRMMNKDKRISFSMGEVPKTDEPKTEEPKTEEPKTEDPKAPEIVALYAKIAPTEHEAKNNETVSFVAVAEGGKAPYTYEWEVRMSQKLSRVKTQHTYVAISETDIGAEAAEGKLSLVATKEYFAKYNNIRCKVTDSEGNSVYTNDCILSYGGSVDLYNDLAESDFLIYVEDKLWITDKGAVITGRIVNGNVKTGDTLKLYHGDGSTSTVIVEGIEMFRKSLDEGKKGDNVGILLGGLGVDKDTVLGTIEKGEALVKFNSNLIPSDYIRGTFTLNEGAKLDDNTVVNVSFGASDASAYISLCGEQDSFLPGESAKVTLDFDYQYYNVWYVGQTFEIRKDGKILGKFTVENIEYPYYLYE